MWLMMKSFALVRDKLIVKTSSLAVDAMSLLSLSLSLSLGVKWGFSWRGVEITSSRTISRVGTILYNMLAFNIIIYCAHINSGGECQPRTTLAPRTPWNFIIRDSDAFFATIIIIYSDGVMFVYKWTRNNVHVYLLTSRVVVLFIALYVVLYTAENDFGKINAFSLSGLIFCAVAILLCV